MPYYVHEPATKWETVPQSDNNFYPPIIWQWTRPESSQEKALYREDTGLYETYTTAQAAHEGKTDKRTKVSFHIDEYERDAWRARESDRRRGRGSFTSTGSVQRVPWHDADWYTKTDDNGVSLATSHYAYLSMIVPGMVSYTESEEKGHNDRQTRTRPGRYLEKFAPQLTPKQRDEYCAQVKASQDAFVVRFATDADGIERVYRKGPTSCMSHDTDSYASPFHPVRVYGSSDFDIAYLMDEHEHITARAIVWQARKMVGRIYGDNTLLHLLVKDGYTKVGEMLGAKIEAVRVDSDIYVLPYMDVCDSVRLDRRARPPVLVTSDDSVDVEDGCYDAKTTNGLTDDTITRDEHECANCDTMIPEDDTLCDSCERCHYCCTHCDNDYYDDDSQYIENYGTVCESCYDDLTSRCEKCDDVFCEKSYTRTEQRRRSAEDLTDYCSDCADAVEVERAEENETADEDTDTEDGINETEDEKSPF